MSDPKLIIGRTGSGKTHRLQQLITAHADDPTTTVWAITPYDELDGADRHTHIDGAEQLLTDVLTEVDRRYASGHEHTPTEAEPRIRLIVDQVDLAHELLGKSAPFGHLLTRVAVIGRKAGVDIVLTASTTHLDRWPVGLHRHFDRPGTTEILPSRRHDDEA
ncbi:hypothetical protein ACIQOV_41950 [Kitasatospora sp. NPDC091257]|uniref:hypothetical protein n=1 Tax=Kitasatospora sp. NPDC091257 TaxID=3364084 RepID=UPI003804B0B9